MEDEDRIRQAGLRVTAARPAITRTLREGDHLDVDTVCHGVRGRIGRVSPQGVVQGLGAAEQSPLSPYGFSPALPERHAKGA